MGEILPSRIPGQLARIGLLFVLCMGALVGVYYALQTPRSQLVYLDILPPIVETVVGALLMAGGRRLRRVSAELGGTWRLIGLAVIVYAAGDFVWAYLELASGSLVFPSLADVLYLLYFPVFFLGTIRLVYGRISQAGRVNMGLDLATVLLAAALVFWNLLIGPVVQSTGGQEIINQIILWAYPVGDLVLLSALILIIYYQSDEMEITSSITLGIAIAVMVCTDCVYAYQTLAGTYVSGTLLDTGWVGAQMLTGLAILPQLRWKSAADRERGVPAREAYLAFLRALRSYLPHAALLTAYVLLLRSGLDSLPMSPWALGLGLGVIVVLILLRQLTTYSENAELAAQLVSKANQLENANREYTVEVIERRRIEEKLSYDTLHDVMTGLPNRALFLNMLTEAIGLARRRPREYSFAVLFIDIDHFKVVNDSLGHMIGDELLWAIGARLKGALHSVDTLARFGGDEFAILMDAMAHGAGPNAVAERVQRSLQQAFRIQGHELHMSASIGIVGDVASYEQAEDLLRDADLAMYEAKSMGKSRFQTFAVRMRNRAFLRLDLEADLRKGLGNGELQVHYQPIVSLKTDLVCGLEALVRWKHPSRGLLRPRDFLGVAEESGLILRMGQQVLGAACEEMARLQEHHPSLGELGVSVNLSNKQFTQPGLVGEVGTTLRRTGLPPRALKLEITERVLIENLRLANRLFNELKHMGVDIDIDDFGTGYSALSYLQNFPIHALKIDKGFIDSMRRSRRGLGLVRAIVAMAHELGMETVAEGITSRGQLGDLKELGCDYGQGQLLSRPLAARGIEVMMRRLEPNGHRITPGFMRKQHNGAHRPVRPRRAA